MRLLRFAPLALALVAGFAHAQPKPALTLDTIMADPDWIGAGVEAAWWRWDGQSIEFQQKRAGSTIRDNYRIAAQGGSATRLADAARADLDGTDAVYSPDRRRTAFVRNGDVFVRDLASGALTQLTRDLARASRPQWSQDGALVWQQGADWYRWDGRMTALAAAPRASDAPGKPPKADDLRERQLRLIDTLREERERRDAAREQNEAWQAADASRAPAAIHLGADVEIEDSALSPDGRWLLVITRAKNADAGKLGQMPKYVTESGYEEFETVRTRVGRNQPIPHRLWLAEVATGTVREVKFDNLPGINQDPLAALRSAAGKEALKGARPARLMNQGRGGEPAIIWSADSAQVALAVRAIDNKDRWLATLNLEKAALEPRHRLHDEAWINWDFNDFGWLPDNRTLWFLSEESGWSHLYTQRGNSKPTRLTQGQWEVSNIELSRDGQAFHFRCNRNWPGDYELCSVPVTGGAMREITALDGVESFSQSPDGRQFLLRVSSSYTPPQLAVIGADGESLKRLTDTRSEDFRQYQFIQPEYVRIPSKHGAGEVWGKFYGPAQMEAGKQYPIVLFVHGAGYLVAPEKPQQPVF